MGNNPWYGSEGVAQQSLLVEDHMDEYIHTLRMDGLVGKVAWPGVLSAKRKFFFTLWNRVFCIVIPRQGATGAVIPSTTHVETYI